jgi:hypothetical protein
MKMDANGFTSKKHHNIHHVLRPLCTVIWTVSATHMKMVAPWMKMCVIMLLKKDISTVSDTHTKMDVLLMMYAQSRLKMETWTVSATLMRMDVIGIKRLVIMLV